MSTALLIDHLSLAYGRHHVINDLSLRLEVGDIACLLGPSGSGKTTLLRAIAGFERPVAGDIQVMDKMVASAGIFSPPEQRNVGMVFQDFALFPHLTVAENIGFGLHRLRPSMLARRVNEMLELVDLEDLSERYPHTLSGGQQQRVALARALAPQPALLLLDEPFASIDVELREQLAADVRTILKASGTSAILVSHHQLEAFAMADCIGVIYDKRLLQWDSPYNLYHRPASPQVADFIGEGTLLTGRITARDEVQTEMGLVCGPLPPDLQTGMEVSVLVRPDDVLFDDTSPSKAVVVRKAFRGAEFLYTLALPSGVQVLCLAPSHHDYALMRSVGIRLDVDHLVVFAKSGGAPDLAS